MTSSAGDSGDSVATGTHAVEPTAFTVAGEAGALIGDVWEPIGGVDPVDEILMMHGGAQTRNSWNRAARRLATEGYRVTTMDARGHGDSDWATDGDYDLYRLVDDLELIVAARFPDRRPVLVGASLGGLTGMLAMGEGRDVARALVLVDVTPKIEAKGVERIGEFMRSGLEGFDSLEQAAEAIAAYQPNRERPGTLDGLRKNLRRKQDGRWYWHWDPRFVAGASGDNADIGTAFFEKLVSNIGQPTMLIRGSRSDIVSDESVEHLLRHLPHAHTHEVVDAGHMVAGDDNAVFLDQLEWFLTEVVGSPPLVSRATE